MSFAFAGKGDSSIGVHVGYGMDALGMTSKSIGIFNGVYFSGSYEYGISEDFVIKGEVGANSLSTYTKSIDGSSTTIKFNRPMGVALYAGFAYTIPFGKDGRFSIDPGAGVDVLLGNITEHNFNAAIGLGIDAIVKFKISEDLAITATSRTGIPLFHTNKDYAKAIKEAGWFNFTVKSSFGVVYTL